MNIWQSAAGMMEVELTSADLWATIHQINEQNIPVYAVQSEDDLTARFRIDRRNWKAVCVLCEKRGDNISSAGKKGLFWSLRQLLQRPVLTGGMLLLLAMMLWFPTRVFFVQVEGNSRIPGRQILAAAEATGVRFGASRRKVRSERIKNALLAQIPELQWAGVNTRGCVAVISVRERSEKADTEQSGNTVCSIVAAEDGVVTSFTALRGNVLCTVGQAVKKGEVLISGYTDCGLSIRAERAEGEIYAQTKRTAAAAAPAVYQKRISPERTKRKVSLLIGKKRINLWKCSGIWEDTCGRIYMEQYAALPGGFRLPVGIAREEITAYETAEEPAAPEEAEAQLKMFCTRYISEQMQAGTILHSQYVCEEGDGFYLLKMRCSCQEMIGRLHWEQMGDNHGETD